MSKLFLKIKLKSLATEARIIRGEEVRIRNRARKRRAKGHVIDVTATLDAMHYHRIKDVRREARATHLAYGFLRGRSYTTMENKASRTPDWSRVEAMIKKYGDKDAIAGLASWRPPV